MKNSHPLTWVVVADKCKAKIYQSLKFPKIEEIANLVHPESGILNQDLVSSKPGHSSNRGGCTGVSYQPEHEPKQNEAAKFARHLGNYLSSANQKGDFNRLYIFAAPTFLGLLRDHITPETHKSVVAEVSKELTAFSIADIEKHLSNL